MTKISRDDAYYLGLIYTFIYLKETIVLEDDLENFYVALNEGSRNGEKEVHIIDNTNQEYYSFMVEDDVKMCTLNKNFVLRLVINEFVNKLPVTLLVASQSNAVLETLRIKKGSKNKPEEVTELKEETSTKKTRKLTRDKRNNKK